jgi:hypothetical protein
MTSPALQWFLRGCLLVAGLLAATGSWHLASWAMNEPDPVRVDLLAQAGFALSLGFYFSLAAVVAALMLLVAWARQPFAADAMP